MRVVPFLPLHLDGFKLQDDQLYMQEHLTDAYAYALSIAGPSYSGIVDGECIGCAGFIFSEPHKAVVWSLLSNKINVRNMLPIHRAVSKEFDRIDAKRIELITRDVPSQKRWAEMLGMTLETPDGMPGYWFDGEIGFLYGKVK